MSGSQGFGLRELVLVLGALMSGATASAADWKIVDLGTLGGNFSEATDINDLGQIVGFSANAAGDSRAFLYSDGTMQDLGTLGGLQSYARGINNKGQIVGESTTPSGDTHAFVYSGGATRDLGTLGGSSSYATAINDNGQIVGRAQSGPPGTQAQFRAFLYSNGGMQDLAVLAPEYALYPETTWSTASGINNKGHVTGLVARGVGNGYAFLYRNGAMHNIGGVPGHTDPLTLQSKGMAINESDQVAGARFSWPHVSNPIIYADGTIRTLATFGGLEGAAHGINNKGQVVGFADKYAADASAFLYSDGQMLDLNTLPEVKAAGWTLRAANAVNSCGQIVGLGLREGRSRAFLLTPVTQSGIASCSSAAKPTLTVAVSGAGSGTVTSTVAGINCGVDCSESYDPDTTVTLTAMPLPGSSFGGWSGACMGQRSACVVTMEASKSVTATFMASNGASGGDNSGSAGGDDASSGGGCALRSNRRVDPVLPFMLMVATSVLYWRRRRS